MREAELFVENRVYRRSLVQVRVGYRVISEPKETELILLRQKGDGGARSVDISLGGIYLLTNHVLKTGYLLRLYISLQDGLDIVAPLAEVVWTNGKGSGLRFLSMRRNEKEQLRAYLEKFSHTS